MLGVVKARRKFGTGWQLQSQFWKATLRTNTLGGTNFSASPAYALDMPSPTIVRVAQASSRVVGVHKKYTVQSTGVWERIRRLLSIDPSRSNGVPLNAQFRNPTPGALDPLQYDDPVTLPASDLADNPYWKRDTRRAYPRLSVVSQGDVVGLLSVGSAKQPKQELIGDSGRRALVSASEQAEKGLAAYFREKKDFSAVLDSNGLPPLPSSLRLKKGMDRYELTEENAFPEGYPCRTFA